MATSVVDSLQTIGDMEADGERSAPLDLHRVEIMNMPHSTYSVPTAKDDNELAPTACIFVKGLVMDHGSRHPGMPTLAKNCHVMTCNVSLEYEKTEVQSGFFYSNAEEREKLVESERKWLDERCRLVVEFKRKVCKEGEVSAFAGLPKVISTRKTPIAERLTHFLFPPSKYTVLCHDQSKR